MPPQATMLVLLSCLGHASWNLLAKRGRNQIATLWWSLLCAGLLLLPVSIVYFLFLGVKWPLQVWVYFCLSGLSQSLYIYSLARAYGSGDLSVVYPLTRCAPLFVALWAGLWLGETIDGRGGLGIAMVVAGAVVLAIPARQQRRHTAATLALAWAVATALFSSFYSVLDRAVMLELHGVLAKVVYLHLSFSAMWVGMTLLAIGARPWRHSTSAKSLLNSMAIAILALGTYLLVLWVFSMPAAGVGYVVAMRQFSAIIGVIFGWRLLREPRGWIRLAGATVTVIGLSLLALPQES